MSTLGTWVPSHAFPIPTQDPQAPVWVQCDTATGCAALEVPGGPRYEIDPRSATIKAFERLDAPADEAIEHYWRVALPIALQLDGAFALHGSAISRRQRVAALCGVSGTGKSTLAVALHARGYGYWADDTTLIRPTVVGVDTVRLPCRPSLAEDAFTLLGPAARLVEPLWSCASATPYESNWTPGEADIGELALIVLLRRDGVPKPVVRALAPAEAFTALLPHAHAADLSRADTRHRLASGFLDLVAHVPVIDLAFAAGADHLPLLLNILDENCARQLDPRQVRGDHARSVRR